MQVFKDGYYGKEQCWDELVYRCNEETNTTYSPRTEQYCKAVKMEVCNNVSKQVYDDNTDTLDRQIPKDVCQGKYETTFSCLNLSKPCTSHLGTSIKFSVILMKLKCMDQYFQTC